MSHQIPPPTRIPKKFQEDIELRGFFDELLRSMYLMWSGINRNVSFYGEEEVSQGASLTASETTITHTAPGTPDYAIQDLTTTTPYGFVSQDEGNTVLQVIANLQTRVDELEARLDSTTGVGLIE
jgi:hypothetical protein